MLFNSNIFMFIFLPTTFFIYFYLNNKELLKTGKTFLVLSSLFFYGWWNISYLPIIIASVFFNYYIGVILSKKRDNSLISNKNILIIGIAANILLLGYYKYMDFFIENINFLLGGHISLLHLVLPLAISFFTFQQVAYLVDSYRGETKEYNFLNYANFVTFFPQLIAGPIVHHSEMIPQFTKVTNNRINYRNISLGLFIFAIGLFKKVVLADTFSVWANNGYDIAKTLNFVEAWVTSLSYTFQLYFDFSGYTDMALGAALLFNIKLPINFNSPYKAISIQDFWKRWHITLSRFLRDYIYIPLGGNRKSRIKTYNNLLITFIIGGIWHGAGWTFLFWGFIHGAALIVQRIWGTYGKRLNKIIAWTITFNFVNVAWIFFRADQWDDATKVLKGMVDIKNIILPKEFEYYLSSFHFVGFGDYLKNIDMTGQSVWLILIGFVIVLFFRNSTENLLERKLKIYHAIFIAGIFFYAYLQSIHNAESQFLYFNF